MHYLIKIQAFRLLNYYCSKVFQKRSTRILGVKIGARGVVRGLGYNMMRARMYYLLKRKLAKILIEQGFLN